MSLRVVNFIVLFLILLIGVLAFWGARTDRTTQMVIGIIMAISYVLWGIIFHVLERDIHPKVVVEYLFVGLIAVILIATIVWT